MTAASNVETPVLLKPEIFNEKYTEGSDVYTLM
jgi:hypothetical protein